MIIEPDNLSLPRSREIVDLIAELGFAPHPKALPRCLSTIFACTPNDVL